MLSIREQEATFCSSGTNTFLAFLIIGCGFSSSSENLCLRGLNSSPPGTLDKTRSVGSGWKLTSTSIASGSMGDGVLRSSVLRSKRMTRSSELAYKRSCSDKTEGTKCSKQNISFQNLSAKSVLVYWVFPNPMIGKFN